MARIFGISIPILFVPMMLIGGDRDPSPVHKMPLKKPLPLIPLIQRDSHSCGFLALSAVYNSYGLDPVKSNLKARLGTDIPLVPFLPETKGTVQPDFFRVLTQDGFATNSVFLQGPNAKQRIIDHLRQGHYALSLIKRRSNGHLHWVVLTRYAKGSVTVGDSLRVGLYKEPFTDYFENHLQNVILLAPTQPAPQTRFLSEHVTGIVNMLSPWWVEFIAAVALATSLMLIRQARRRNAHSLSKK